MFLITSFNKVLHEEYGNRMVHEFSEKTDGSVKLIVVYEGSNVPNIKLHNVEFVLFQSKDHQEFIRKFGHLHEAKGLRIKSLPNNQLNLSMDFRFDAVRFSFKIFSLLQTIELFSFQKNFAWIDADIRCLKNFNTIDLLKFFPNNDQLMSYLGRDNFPPSGAYSECGFLGFNPQHPQIMDFLKRIAITYRDGEIFSHQQWHDSWIWDQIRFEFESKNIKFKNISGDASSMEHPFINCGLGDYFDHLKGPERKRIGKSFEEDYRKS
jgi:hypothetical protein